VQKAPHHTIFIKKWVWNHIRALIKYVPRAGS
jgi:hypothetical protein